jgi:hypothetical protein
MYETFGAIQDDHEARRRCRHEHRRICVRVPSKETTVFHSQLADPDVFRKMDCAAAVHRLKVGVPATVEHSAEEGVETARWIAETTQVLFLPLPPPSCRRSCAKIFRYRTLSHSWTPSSSNCAQKISSIPSWPNSYPGTAGSPKATDGRGGQSSCNGKKTPFPLRLPRTARLTPNADQCSPRTKNRLITLNQMKASDEITEEQSREVKDIVCSNLFLVSELTPLDADAIRRRERVPRVLRGPQMTRARDYGNYPIPPPPIFCDISHPAQTQYIILYLYPSMFFLCCRSPPMGSKPRQSTHRYYLLRWLRFRNALSGPRNLGLVRRQFLTNGVLKKRKQRGKESQPPIL